MRRSSTTTASRTASRRSRRSIQRDRRIVTCSSSPSGREIQCRDESLYDRRMAASRRPEYVWLAIVGAELLRVSARGDRPHDLDAILARAVDLVVFVHRRIAVRHDQFELVAVGVLFGRGLVLNRAEFVRAGVVTEAFLADH